MLRKCSVLILAAGRSGRMGKPKIALEMPDGSNFLAYAIRQYQSVGCRPVTVVLNELGWAEIDPLVREKKSGLVWVINPHPESGRFSSIRMGIQKIPGDRPTFIHNVDNPYAGKQLLIALYGAMAGVDVVQPVYEGKGGHPVLISGRVVEGLLASEGEDIRLDQFLSQYPQRQVEIDDPRIRWNINTPADYALFRARADKIKQWQ